MIDINKFQAMQMDITNNCNIRCRFCINDWSKQGETVYMNSETFNKAIELLPLVSRGFLSCAFEPIIHPDFINFFKRIPKGTEPYTFITTNLAKKLTAYEILELGNMNLNSITISISSFNPKIYEELHTGAKFDTFINNLEQIVSIFRQKPNAPKLRFITIAFKQNLDELEYIAKMCFGKYDSTMNQFRTPFKSAATIKKKKWLKKSNVSKEEWDIVSSKLEKLPYNISFFNPLYGANFWGSNPGEKGVRQTNTYFSFRSDGIIIFHESDKKRLPEEFKKDFNINKIDNPVEFFKKGLQKIEQLEKEN